MRRGVTEPLQISHRRALFQSFWCGIHEKRVKLTTKNTKDTKKFAAAKMRRRCAIFPVMRRFSQWLLVAMLAATACGQRPTPASDFGAKRQRMVERQLKARDIKDERVLAAMAKVPREEFVTADERGEAYED